MPIIRSDFHTNLANVLRDEVFYGKSNIYYYIGKIDQWDDEIEPPVEPDITSANDTTIRDNILYTRRVTSNDVALVCTNYTWTEGTVYQQWDHTKDMSDLAYYVVTDEFNVYKCLNNNNGTPSTEKPSGTNLGVIATSDGYLWKYLYNIPTNKRRRFLSPLYIPVQTALTDSFYSKGAVDEVIVIDGGEDYLSTPITTVAVQAAPPGGVTAEVQVYVNPITGEIDSYDIVNPGSGYVTAPTLTVIGDGSGKYGNTTALLTAYIFQGKLDRVAIVDPGVNYSADTSTTIIVDGDGTGARFYPKIQDGQIIGVTIGDPGMNYSYANLIVSGSTGSGAVLRAIIGTSDFISDQSLVEQSAVPGAIYAIEVTTGGEGYTDSTTVTIVGDGTGATAHAEIIDGEINRIIVDTYGSGYSSAQVIIEDTNRFEPNTFIDATAYTILPPLGGHGSNAEKELFANTTGIYVLVRDDSGLSALYQNYRQFGLLRNPLENITRRRARAESYIVTFTCTIASVDGIAVDDVLISLNKRYRVVHINGTEIVLQQLSSIYSVPNGTFLHETSGMIYTIISIDETPTLNKYSGDLLYVSNTTSFVPTETQAFGVRTYITF